MIKIYKSTAGHAKYQCNSSVEASLEGGPTVGRPPEMTQFRTQPKVFTPVS